MLQQRADFCAAEQRDQRQGEIGQRLVDDEGVAHALGQFFDAPFHGDAGGDDAAHAGAADIIERHARLLQRLQHADMGKAARAAARQHDVDRRARDEARKALDVVDVAGAHMVMRAEKIAAEFDMLAAVRACDGPPWMHQQQFRRRGHLALEKTPLEGMQRQALVGARDQQNAVGLAQAELRPGAVGLIALIEDDVVFGFEAVEPFGGFARSRRRRARRPWRPS